MGGEGEKRIGSCATELKNEGGKDEIDVGDLLATWGHGGVQAQDAAKGYVRGPTPTGVCVDIHGPCCHLRSHRYSGSGLPALPP